MLRIIWLFILAAGTAFSGGKAIHAISTGCMILVRRAGVLKACTHNEPLIFYGMLSVWFIFVAVLLYAAFRSMRNSLQRGDR